MKSVIESGHSAQRLTSILLENQHERPSNRAYPLNVYSHYILLSINHMTHFCFVALKARFNSASSSQERWNVSPQAQVW